jgi:hypothetical protein
MFACSSFIHGIYGSRIGLKNSTETVQFSQETKTLLKQVVPENISLMKVMARSLHKVFTILVDVQQINLKMLMAMKQPL